MKYCRIDLSKYWFEEVRTIDTVIDILQARLEFYIKAKTEGVLLTEAVDNGYIYLETDNVDFAKEYNFEEVGEEDIDAFEEMDRMDGLPSDSDFEQPGE